MSVMLGWQTYNAIIDNEMFFDRELKYKDEGVTRLAHSVAGGKSQELRACS